MFSILIIEVFEKAKKEIQSDVVTHLSVHITDKLWEKNRFQINERTLRNYYRKAASEDQEDTIKLSPKVALLLCQYLGYDSYYNFILHHKRPTSLFKTILESSERNIIITLMCLCLLLIIVNLNFMPLPKKKTDYSMSKIFSTPQLKDQESHPGIPLYPNMRCYAFYLKGGHLHIHECPQAQNRIHTPCCTSRKKTFNLPALAK